MEIDKKPNQEKTIENSEKNILFRFPIFNKTKPYLWLKAVLPEKDEYQDIYRIAFNASFFKTLNINGDKLISKIIAPDKKRNRYSNILL